jgi:hypothetical protein
MNHESTIDQITVITNVRLFDGEHAFIKNPDKTYGLTELSKKFGGKDSTLTIDLAMLSLDRLDRRVINGETYYSLKKNAQI